MLGVSQSHASPCWWIVDRAALHHGNARRALRHHDRAGDSIGKIVTTTSGMINLIATSSARPTLQPEELTLQAIVVEERDSAAVEQRKQLLIYFGLGQLARIVLDPVATELLRRPLAGVTIRGAVRSLTYFFPVTATDA
jgi:hypothetical protein